MFDAHGTFHLTYFAHPVVLCLICRLHMGAMSLHYQALLDRLRDADLPVAFWPDDKYGLHYFLAVRMQREGLLEAEVDDDEVVIHAITEAGDSVETEASSASSE